MSKERIPTIRITCPNNWKELGLCGAHLKKPSQSYPEFIPAKSINYTSNNTFGNAVNIQIYNSREDMLGGRDPWTQSNSSLTYQSNSANLAIKACNDENSFNYLKQQTKFDHSNQQLGDNEIKHIANVVKTGELPNLRILDLHGNDFGLEGMLALFEMMQSPNVKSLTVILCSSKECQDTINFLDKMTNYYIAEFAKRNQHPDTYIVSDQACLKTLSMAGSNIFSGLIKCAPSILKGSPSILGDIKIISCISTEFLDPNFAQESVGCVAKINDFLDSFFQKKIQEPKPVQSQIIHQSSTLTPSFKKEVNSIQEQEKQKSDRWAKSYMDSLVNQGGSDSSHPAYYLFSNAYTYALSKSTDTSKSFFAHYMDSLVNQGAGNPQHPYYYMFSNAYAYALKNQ